jgi:hypothetical protein
MDSFEAMYPFFAFRTLTANVEHMVIQLTEFKKGLRDAGRAKARTKNILIVWKIVFLEQAIDIGVVASRGFSLPFSVRSERPTIECYHAARIHCHA